jgi:hypothetical protein
MHEALGSTSLQKSKIKIKISELGTGGYSCNPSYLGS